MKAFLVLILLSVMSLTLVGLTESPNATPSNAQADIGDEATAVRLSQPSETENLPQTLSGEAIYKANCANCHRADGTGLFGPPSNLRLSKLDSIGIREVVQLGRPTKGMKAYKDILKPSEIDSVVGYVLRFQRLDP